MRGFLFDMIRIGDFNELKTVRSTSVGVFLEDQEGTEILLPNKYVPNGIKLGDLLKVFCYLDHEERPIATTLHPKIIRDGFAFLFVAQINRIGAFMDWGLEKQLLAPYSEQLKPMNEGQGYLVHCYLDKDTFRLVATSKVEKYLKKEGHSFQKNDEVSLLAYRKTNIGWEVIINQAFKGLLFFNDIFREIRSGDRLKGYIKNVREDGKIDVSLQPSGVVALESSALRIVDFLKENGGKTTLNDKSTPEEIKEQLQMSKKAFKKGVGILYKQRKISLSEQGIQLTDKTF